jgi:diacylglycerol kinase
MPVELKPSRFKRATRKLNDQKRRQPWRQHLVMVERGIINGMRSDSSFFAQFFGVITIIAAGFVLKISLLEWTMISLAISFVITAELFNQVIRAILDSVGHLFDESARKAMSMGTAAVFVSAIGAILVTGLIFGQRIYHTFF